MKHKLDYNTNNKKQFLKSTVTKTINNNIKVKTTNKPTTQIVVPTIKPYKAYYVTDFDDMCGNSAEENRFLTWCQSQGINSLYFYNLNTVIASSYTAFTAFKDKAITYGILADRMFGFRSSQNSLIGSGFSSNKSYNLANSTKKIGYSYEDEFWNYDSGTGTPPAEDAKGNLVYSEWIKAMQAIQTYAKANSTSNDFYMGKVRDLIQSTNPTIIADGLVKYTDRIYLDWYVETATFIGSGGGLNRFLKQANYLGDAAKRAGKTITIIPIFAGGGTSDFMKVYFQTHTLQQAADRAKTLFNAATTFVNDANVTVPFTGKANIKLEGFNGYRIYV